MTKNAYWSKVMAMTERTGFETVQANHWLLLEALLSISLGDL